MTFCFSRRALLVVTLASSAALAGCNGRLRLATLESKPTGSEPGEQPVATPSTLTFMPNRHTHAATAAAVVVRHPLRRTM